MHTRSLQEQYKLQISLQQVSHKEKNSIKVRMNELTLQFVRTSDPSPIMVRLQLMQFSTDSSEVRESLKIRAEIFFLY